MNKAVVFGIDGGSLKLIEQWRDELPNFKKIMGKGVYGGLESTIPPLTCPAWPAMFTGKNPAQLGMYDFIKYLPHQKQKFKVHSSLNYSSSAIWTMLNAHDKKVGLFNVAMTFPPQKIDSFMVCGLGAPPAIKSNYTHPPELKKTLDEVTGGYEIIPLMLLTIPGKEKQYMKVLNETLAKREKAASYLMENLPWDLFVCVFYVLDSAQHYFWHHMDETHPKRGDRRYRNVIKDLYIKVDGAIGRLMEQLPKGTNVLIVSDHGFGPSHGSFVVNRWLENNNFLKLKGKFHQQKTNTTLLQIRDFLMLHLDPRLTQMVAKMLPRVVREKLANVRARRDDMITSYQNIDWSQTKAFGLSVMGMIYINLKGRESWGIVEPGQEYEELRDEIITKLKQVTDPETGKAVDIKVFKKEEVYHGQYLDIAPDILYRMPKYPQVASLKNEAEWGQPSFFGNHELEGIFFAEGPDIKQSGEKLPGLKIYDIAPTLLHMFGLAVPKDIDGRVLTEIFKKESEPGQREVKYQKIDREAERVRHKIKELKKLKKL
jgi:predicted AlkP superfamily phosphohydrolase/phosphomutase